MVKPSDKQSFAPQRVAGVSSTRPTATTIAAAATAPARDEFHPCATQNCVLQFGHPGTHAIPMTAIPSLGQAKPEPRILAELRQEKQRLKDEVISHERAAMLLDEKCAAIERRISWLERHPEADEIFNFVEDVRKSLARDRESIQQAG